VLVALVSCTPREAPPEAYTEEFAELRLTRATFSELDNWFETDTDEAFTAFMRSCGAITAMPEDAPMTGADYGGAVSEWVSTCRAAANVSGSDGDAIRIFFEAEFVPYWVAEGESEEGLFTGYFEPELRGSTLRQGAFQTPLYGPPADLVSVDLGLFRENLTGQRLAGRLQDGRLVPFDTRAEIARNGLEQAEELLYVDDPVDAFFLHIQGSGRVQLEDGSVVRAAYAGQNGHPYTAIGAVLIAREELTREEVSMQSIRDWLNANPNEAQDLLEQNASYIFFTIEPLDDPALGARGTQGVPLTAKASLAVDASTHPLGAPIWLETTVPLLNDAQTPFHRLLIAQDTGGAIRGAVRGDIYWGVGEEAGEIAGRMRSLGKMAVLVPRALAENIGENFVPDRARP
jgi:membrane-bound lytic murein transglycosylase A